MIMEPPGFAETPEDNQPRKSFRDIQRDAILAEARERAVERDRVEGLVKPWRHQRLGEIVRLGDDYLAEVLGGDKPEWTTVVGGKAASQFHYTQEQAILHLIARRYDDNPNTNGGAAFYAGRVLGLPEDDDA